MEPDSRSQAEPRLDQAARARLLLNTEEVADTFVELAGHRYAILHLPVGKLEQFRAATSNLESLLIDASADGASFEDVLYDDVDRLFRLALEDIPRAAALALRMTTEEVRSLGVGPLDLIDVVLTQWLHNAEADKIAARFGPPPPDEDDELEIDCPDDPTEENPFAIVERMATGYQWTLEQTLALTLPQIYLIGNAGSWSWHRSELKSKLKSGDEDGPRPRVRPVKDGKPVKRIKDMTADEYKIYIANMFGGRIAGQ